MKVDKFNESLMNLLNDRLSVHLQENMDRSAYYNVYNTIFLSLQEVVLNVPQLAKIMSHDSMNFVAQAYYDMILVNGSIPLDPNIFQKRVYASNLPTDELHVLLSLLQGTPIAAEIIVILKKRS